MTVNEPYGDAVPVEVGPKRFYIQLGDMPLGLTRRINSSQVSRDLGMTIPGHIGGVLNSVQDRALYFLVNPYDHSTTGNGEIAYAYTQMFATFDQKKLQHASSLPESIDSGTTIVCIFTNGNVSAILITDKPDIKAKSETKTD